MVERKPFRRRSFLKAGGVAGVGLLAGCSGGGSGSGGESETSEGDDGGSDGGTSQSGGSGGSSGDPVVIGSLQPLSGSFTPWGNAHRAGLAFAVQEVNDDGGVLGGRQLKIVEADTKSDAGQADSIFRRFVEQENAVATVGPVSSDVGIRTARTAQELEVPMLLHMSGTNKAITPDTTYTFRVGLLPAATTMQAQANLVADAGYSKVGAIIGDYAWGRSVEAGIQQHFDVDVNVQAAPVGASDFKSFIRKYPQDLEMMVATGHPPGSLTIASQMNELGYSPEVITGPSFPPGVIAGALGDLAFKGGFTHVHNTDVYSDEFAQVAKRFGEAQGEQFDTHSAYGYVSGKMLAQAVEDAGSADPTAIADAVRSIKFDTLFANPIEYTKNGELKNQVQIYSQLTSEAPSYFPDGKFGFEEQFRTDALPALPADQ
ncbi:branched-chain amino acid ABC transporter substrate-binding protein [Halogeometricum pallidum JCM 14848]|uniref:Branched-chain amino acid ABC transporter substrate-binding protein n=1 Tax=Halogeometricum pallidum JCM 14848 TaxID=1227487 RepID=M0CVV8_HALPD|nr:ABC transporter substrate-binding protein [Halogeometricum pallidum]ELZ27381.1 branched-chain amino acid ABC transporter substrate-binding protein [Halogeometricum pallidum JCM 14848]